MSGNHDDNAFEQPGGGVPPSASILIPLILGSSILLVVVYGSYRFAVSRREARRRQFEDMARNRLEDCRELLKQGHHADAETVSDEALTFIRKAEAEAGPPALALRATGLLCRAKARAGMADEKKRTEALGDLAACLELAPRDPNVFFLRGQIRHDMGKQAVAEQDFTEAIRLNPHFGAAFLERARLRRLRGDVGGAEKDVAAARRLGMPVPPDLE